MKRLAAALTALLYLSSPSAARIHDTPQGSTSAYEQSIAAKGKMPCVEQILSKHQPSLTMDFLKKTRGAKSDIQKVLGAYEPPDDKGVDVLLGIPKKYDECVAFFSIYNPVPDEFYKNSGREKPSLTGTYEEQVALVVKDVSWWKGIRKGTEQQTQAQNTSPRAAKKHAVTELKQLLCNLPSSISADMSIAINTGRDYFRGRFWPTYNLEYRDEGVIQIDYAMPPQDMISEYSPNELARYRISRSTTGWNTAVLLDKNGNVLLDQNGRTSMYTAHSPKALIKYLDAQNHAGEFKWNRAGRMCDTTKAGEVEFWNLVNRVGDDFSGTLNFRKNYFITERQGKHVEFERMGLRASSPARELSFATYHTKTGRNGEGHYVEAFNLDFNEWLSFGGGRQVADLGYGLTVMMEERK